MHALGILENTNRSPTQTGQSRCCEAAVTTDVRNAGLQARGAVESTHLSHAVLEGLETQRLSS